MCHYGGLKLDRTPETFSKVELISTFGFHRRMPDESTMKNHQKLDPIDPNVKVTIENVRQSWAYKIQGKLSSEWQRGIPP